jgi:hypothetical protein
VCDTSTYKENNDQSRSGVKWVSKNYRMIVVGRTELCVTVLVVVTDVSPSGGVGLTSDA